MIGYGGDIGGVVDLRIAFGIAHAEAAAQIQQPEGMPRFLLHARKIRQHDICGVAEGSAVENLRADVAVEALQRDGRRMQRLSRQLQRLPRFDGGAELAVYPPRDDRLKGVRVDAGRKTQQYPLRHAAGGGVGADARELLGVVHDEQPHAAVDAKAHVVHCFGAAVKDHALRGEAGLQRGVKLAGGDNVGAQPLLAGEAVYALEAQRLAGQQHRRAGRHVCAHSPGVQTHAPAQPVLVHDVQRRSVFSGQLHAVEAGDAEMALFVDGMIRLKHDRHILNY